MDIDALIAAAKALDSKAALHGDRLKRFARIEALISEWRLGSQEFRECQERALLAITAKHKTDYGDEINDLRAALRKRPKKKQDSPT